MVAHAAPAAPAAQASNSRITLVLGGARSGKSAYALSCVEGERGPWIYLATAEPGDKEMAARIAKHRLRRGAHWTTVEEPLDLAGALARVAGPDGAILVDCLTLWLSNLMAAGRNIEGESRRLAETLPSVPGRVVFVSNEVGLGIVPANAEARAFRDHAGRLHQMIAEAADRVVFMAAGLPMVVK